MIVEGQRLLLLEAETNRRFTIAVTPGARKEKGLGVVDPARFIGASEGDEVQVGTRIFTILQATWADEAATLKRKAQIIGPKDVASILFHFALSPGQRVLESGIGSAGTTIPLAAAVGITGEVVVQELREDFATWAMNNLRNSQLDSQVTVHIGDLTQALHPDVKGPFDALLLDQPEPWLALPHAYKELRPGARIAVYVPQVGQMESAVRVLRDLGATCIEAKEIIERQWEILERGSRPSFDSQGHTGFLIFARA